MAGRGPSRVAKEMKRGDLQRHGRAWKSKEKQRLCMQGVELTSEGKAWSRSESQRQSRAENGNALKRADLQWNCMELNCNRVAQSRSVLVCSGMASACIAMAKK